MKLIYRNRILQLLIWIAVSLTFSSAAFADELWQKSRSGMTLNEVKKIQPDAVDLPDPGLAGYVRYVAKPLLGIDQVEILGRLFRVTYYFTDNLLEQVSLKLIDDEVRKSDSNLQLQLVNALRLKYGAEMNHNDLGSIESFKWIKGTTTVDLFSQIHKTTQSIHISYSGFSGSISNKL